MEPEVFSISGPPNHLQAYKELFCSDVITRSVNVYSWYHGGKQLEGTIEKVMKDLKDRGVQFAAFSDLKLPVRSTVDGYNLKIETAASATLTEWIIRILLVDCVDWHNTATRLSHVAARTGQGDSGPLSVTSFGPDSGLLLAWTKSIASLNHLQVEDVSSFRQSTTGMADPSHQQDIAIVGIGVNLPQGNGQEELWNTLFQGINVVSEV